MPRFFFLTLTLLLLLTPTPGPARADGPPSLRDDLDASTLRTAVARSVDYLEKLPADRPLHLCDNAYTTGWLVESLKNFSTLVARFGTGTELAEQLRERFDICPADGASSLLVTGYYEPEMAGSMTRTPLYRYPLYRVPADLVSRAGHTGRMVNGQLVPYWSRREIEEDGVLKGLELVYLADPTDAFFLQIQGSGRVRFPDGTTRRVQFAAKNGRPYSSIGRRLVELGKIPLAEVSMPSIRRYLTKHPDERDAILRSNQSFVFFRWGGKDAAPKGSLGEPLTAGRSVALDSTCYPPGALGYLVSSKPIVDSAGRVTGWTEMGRFVLHQDSGSAIKGPNRLDLFWGGDRYAEAAAGEMRHSGTLYFLVQKQQTARRADNHIRRGEL